MPELLINIDVPDLETAVVFYRDGLGMQWRRYLFDGDVAELSLGVQRVFLIQAAEGSRPFAGALQNRQYSRHWTPVHLDIVVDDIAAAVARAVAAGAHAAGETRRFSWGWLAALSDPFGNGLCLVQFENGDY